MSVCLAFIVIVFEDFYVISNFEIVYFQYALSAVLN